MSKSWYTIICQNSPYDQWVYLDGKVSEKEANDFFDIAVKFEDCETVSLFKGKNLGKEVRKTGLDKDGSIRYKGYRI